MKIFTMVSVLACGFGAGAVWLAAPFAVGKGNSASLEARVQLLEDREEIERLLMEYGVLLDKRDFTAYSQLFTADGVWSGSIGTIKGPAAIKAAMEKAFDTAAAPNGDGSFHLLTNLIIDVQGDHATAISKWTFVHLLDKKPGIALAGRYDDSLIRENGHWRFQRRVASSASDVGPK
jgi:ketosteroid isomerase-like protein